MCGGLRSGISTPLPNRQEAQQEKPSSASAEHLEIVLSCCRCANLLFEPVTLRCGHTVCKSCLKNDGSIQLIQNCPKCNQIVSINQQQQQEQQHEQQEQNDDVLQQLPQSLQSILQQQQQQQQHQHQQEQFHLNHVLWSIIEKCFPNQLKAIQLKSLGNEAFYNQKLEQAIQYFSDALQFTPNDYRILGNRAQAFLALKQFDKALEDASRCIELQPDWPKAYFRKGRALMGLSRFTEAVGYFIRCFNCERSRSNSVKDGDSTHPSRVEDQQRRMGGGGACLDERFHEAVAAAFSSSDDDRTPDGSRIRRKRPWSACIGSLQEAPLELSGSSAAIPWFTAPAATPKPPLRPRPRPLFATAVVVGSRRTIEPREDCSRDGIDLELSDLECSLCYRIFYQPVTTPCGHVYCRACLERSLDHRPECPLCKASLASCVAERRFCACEAVEAVINHYFLKEADERRISYQKEIDTAIQNLNEATVPVFVCTVALPTVASVLHVFEPRYRLMLRRCLESGTRQFGMCSAAEQNEQYSKFGCMLEIRDVQYLPDGRCLVDIIGGRRFRVVDRSVRDGYDLAHVEWVSDSELAGQELKELAQLYDAVYQETLEWFDSLPESRRKIILAHHGSFPAESRLIRQSANGPNWLWYAIAILPLEMRLQYAFLSMDSLHLRLVTVQGVLRSIRQREKGPAHGIMAADHTSLAQTA